MSITEPSKTSIRVHEFFWLKLMKGYYRNFVESFDMKGDEKVLDFGCGPGATSKFIAQILEKGGGELTCLDLSKIWIERAPAGQRGDFAYEGRDNSGNRGLHVSRAGQRRRSRQPLGYMVIGSGYV